MRDDYKTVIKSTKRLKKLLFIMPMVTGILFIFTFILVFYLRLGGEILAYVILMAMFELIAIVEVDEEFKSLFKAIRREEL